METPLCHGGFADVWKCQYNGQEVAAKVLRVYLRDDLQRTRRVSCPLLTVCTDSLTVSCTEFLQGGFDLELSPPSKHIAVVGCDDDRDSVRNGVRMDGKWQYQRVREDEWGRRSVEARMSFTRYPCFIRK